jgi:predicted dehydrogenase
MIKRYAIVGAGARALEMYARPIVEQFPATARLVALADTNLARAHYVSRAVGGVPVFRDVATLIAHTTPDYLIVTTVDRYHHTYALQALEAGCDVIIEKPMAIDAEACRAILAAERRSGHTVIVTFNLRYVSYVTLVKELLRSGIIGQVLSVDFEWFLDRRHGADYFRRWHRQRANSGGLLVHKATHHFDLINWWMDDAPRQVFAFGTRRFYGSTRAERGERCSTCAYARRCAFSVDLAADEVNRGLYFDAEGEDGYYRDGCVFGDDIDIWDTMSVNVRYASGMLLTYSLIAYSPYEGWRATLNGMGGRIELEHVESGPHSAEAAEQVRVFGADGEVQTYTVPKGPGEHGGGDARLRARLFGGQTLPDPLNHTAGAWAGAHALLIGVAANQAIERGQPVTMAELLEP